MSNNDLMLRVAERAAERAAEIVRDSIAGYLSAMEDHHEFTNNAQALQAVNDVQEWLNTIDLSAVVKIACDAVTGP